MARRRDDSPAVDVFPMATMAQAYPDDAGGIPGGIDPGAPPKFGTPVVASASGPVPRICGQLERVPPGSALARYKVRFDNPHEFGRMDGRTPRYVLARSQAEAEQHFAQVAGIPAIVAEAKRIAGPEHEARVPAPRFVTVTLPD